MICIEATITENVRDLHLLTDDHLRLCPQVIENGRFVEHAYDRVALIQNWNMAGTALLHLVRQIAQPVVRLAGLRCALRRLL